MNSNSPRLTVVVTVYNGRNYLGQTLQSLSSQSFNNFELLIIDDGSTDGSVSVIEAFHDSRIRIIQQENRGRCSALNRALAETATEYIAYNDQDDLSSPNRFERQLGFLDEHPKADCVFAHYTKFGVGRDWANADKQRSVIGSAVPFEPLRDGSQLPSTMMCRADVLRRLGGSRDAYYPADDWDLQLRLSESARVFILCEPMVQYRFHSGASTYRYFAVMQEKARWAEDQYRRRTEGLPERSFDEFLLGRQAGLIQEFQRWRVDSAKLHMRKAGLDYLDRRDFAAAWHLALALSFNPATISSRVRNLLRCISK